MHSTATPTAVIGPGRTESAPGPARGRTAAARWPRAAQGARNALGLWRACRATQAASTAQVGRLRAERMRASGLERGCQLQEDVCHGLVGAVGDGRPPRTSEVLLPSWRPPASGPPHASFITAGANASKAVDAAARCAHHRAGGRHPKELLRRLEGDADLLREHPVRGSAAARRHRRRLHAMLDQSAPCKHRPAHIISKCASSVAFWPGR